MATLTLAPDLGLLDFDSNFDPNTNPFVIVEDIATFDVAAGPEVFTTVKGLANFRLTLGGVTYEIPQSVRHRLRGKNRGLILWRTDTGESGRFRFFREAPPVFEEQEQAR